jgi:hypothetical protein
MRKKHATFGFLDLAKMMFSSSIHLRKEILTYDTTWINLEDIM